MRNRLLLTLAAALAAASAVGFARLAASAPDAWASASDSLPRR